MYIPDQQFNDRPTLLDILDEFDSAGAEVTDEMAIHIELAESKNPDEESVNENIADSLLEDFTGFEVAYEDGQYVFFGINSEQKVLLQRFNS